MFGLFIIITLLAFLPQHVWEVGAMTFAAVCVVSGLFFLKTGATPPGAEWVSKRTVRLGAYFQILAGVGVGLAAFLVHAEPSCRGCGHRHWGGTVGIVILCIWLVLLVAALVFNLTRSKRQVDQS
jgi:hypothetical protein